MMTTVFKSKRSIFTLAAAVIIPLLVGGLSAFLTAGDMNIYESFSRPFLAPPGWVFPIVWTLLYIMMGTASFLVYESDEDAETKRNALIPYTAQLVMNLFWSTLFFTYRQYLIALIWLMIMWVMILITTIRFFRIRKEAGLMMGALLVWSTFAAYLNLSWYILSI